MTEKALFFYTNGFTGDVGDGAAPYTQEEFRGYNDNWAGEGVVKDTAGALAVSGSSSPLSVAAGRAFVNGFPYYNSATLNPTVATPSAGDTGGRVVLRADWTAQTVRVVVLLSTDGVSTIPSLTQSSGVTYEISLATFVIDTSGNIWTDSGKGTAGVTDTRVFAITNLMTDFDHLTEDARPAEVLIENVTLASDQTVITFNNIPATYRHLKIVMSAAADGGVASPGDAWLRLNNDSGSNKYKYEGDSSSTGDTEFVFGDIERDGSNTGTYLSPYEIWVYNYASTTAIKPITSSGFVVEYAATVGATQNYRGIWVDASAVTRVDLLIAAGDDWIAGSTFSLYGVY